MPPSVPPVLIYIAFNVRKIRKYFNGIDRGLTGIPYGNLIGGPEENKENPSVRIAGVPVKIRIENLPNTSQENYRQTNMYSNSY
jgi:hypothetical protein